MKFNSSSHLYPVIQGMIAAYVPDFIVMLSALTSWNGVPKLSFSKKRLNLQNKYLITVNNNNSNKKVNKT
jgi:hypothetical protein